MNLPSGVETWKVQCVLAVEWSHWWAKDFDRLEAFKAELTNIPQNEIARYTSVLWDWALESLPQNVREKLDAMTANIPTEKIDEGRKIVEESLRYICRRAVFLTGLNYHKAHNADWLRGFLDVLVAADKLDDTAVFEEVLRLKKATRLKKGGPNWGLTQYQVLRGWLAAGLWCLPNDYDRAERLNLLVKPEERPITEDAFTKARKGLGLAL